jgi:hypothetical protein
MSDPVVKLVPLNVSLRTMNCDTCVDTELILDKTKVNPRIQPIEYTYDCPTCKKSFTSTLLTGQVFTRA